MGKFKLSRRAMLKAGGAAMGLPLLEVMLDARPAWAQAAAVPKRFLLCAGGHSLCGSGGSVNDFVVPTNTGTGYDLKTGLAPLLPVQSEVSVISQLRIPTAADNGGTVPAGGRSINFHGYMTSALLSGTRSTGGEVNGPSADQVAAELIAGSTTFRSLAYRVQVSNYVNGGGGGTPLGYKRDGSGAIQEIVPSTSPQQAFQTLFGNFAGGLTPAEVARLKLRQDVRLSVVDRVKRRAEVLSSKLGKADQQRLSLHLEEVRQLEKRVAALPPPVQGICQKPGDPGPDPAVAGGQATDPTGNITYNQNLGYSGEEPRARAFCDLIVMAMACDLTRVATLQLTLMQSFLNMLTLTGQKSDLHELSHGGFGNLTESSPLAVARGMAWHITHYAYLVQRFRDTPEAGGRMIDNMGIVYLCEGGHGNDPSGGGSQSPHSTENMAMLVAGSAGGLKPGQHLRATGMHPANVLATVLKAMGAASDTFGEMRGEIPGLRG